MSARRTTLTALSALIVIIAVAAAWGSPDIRQGAGESFGAIRRFALVAGANDGGPKRMPLRYAASDADAFAAVLTDLGGVRTEDLVVLKEPSRKRFLDAMEDLRRRTAEAAGSAGRVELIVYYSGHSDEEGLLLGTGRLRYDEFRKRIDAVPARIRLAVVDACASGALTRLKGGKRLPAFSVDQSSSLSGYAFLTSSSGNEAAQESDRIRASFFTHYLLTGLRGAADLNQDGRVTLGEAYEFAFHETLSRTEGSQAGAQHPGYDMRLTGTGDLVLTDLRGTSAGLVLDRELHGRLFVRSSSGTLVAELQKPRGRRMELGLEPGLYDLRLDMGEDFYRSLFKVDSLTHHPVGPGDFERAEREPARKRGGDSSSADAAEAGSAASDGNGWISARAAFVPGLGFPGRGPGPWSHHLSLNLFVGEARAIHGFQFALFLNRSREEMNGLQLSAGFNRSAGTSRGMQLAGAANIAEGSHRGLQLALAANAASRAEGVQLAAVNGAWRWEGVQAGLVNAAERGTGVQAGLFNYAGRGTGVQAGLLNFAGRGTGVQAGMINVASEFTGAQVGLVNLARKANGAVFGPLSFIGNGLHDAETAFDDRGMLRTAVLLGGPYNYTWYSFDMKALYPRYLWGGSGGLGVHVPSGPLFADIDAGAGMLFNERDWGNYSVTGRLRLLAGYQPMRYFSVFAGVAYNLEAWPASRLPNLNPGRRGERWGSDIRAERWPGIVLGVRI